MGVFVQQAPARGWSNAEANLVPEHIRGALREFLRRYRELESLKHREIFWMMVVIIIGFLSLWSIMFPASLAFSLWDIILILAFFLVLLQYLRVRRATQHVYINVHILYHHLLGKLEVGFCEHDFPCQCAEDFRKYILRQYGVSLYRSTP